MVDGVRLLAMPDLLPGALRSGWDVWATVRRLAWLRGRRFDLVHAFEARPVVVYPALKAQRAGAKLILDWCDWLGSGGSVEERPSRLQQTLLRPVETYFEDHFRTRADGTTVINRFLGERAVRLGVPPERIVLLRNGAETRAPVIDPRAARQAVGLPESVPILGYIGSSYSRDAELMAKAFVRVRQRQPNARLLLVGYFNRDIERMLGDSMGLVRTGPVTAEQIPTYLAAADLCWLPLRDTGANRGRWPLKLSDYMSAGRPTIATRVGDLPEVIEQYGLGLVTADEPDELAAATLALLGDPERQATLGQSARQAAEGDFSWERLSARLEAFYGQVLAH
jgi:glycosyltransferase involved in cell wall biosynthesis